MTIDASAVARVLGIETNFLDLREGGVLFLPQRIAVLAQGASAATYSLEKYQATSAAAVGNRFGFGSPAHLIARQLFPADGDGVGSIPVTFYPLEDAVGAAAAAGDITPSGAQTAAASYRVRVNEILSEPFVVSPGDAVADICDAITVAINAVLEMPVVATDDTTKVDLVAKWQGVSGNALQVDIVGEDLGVTYAITQPAGGLVNPDLSAALALFGSVWETFVLNGLDIADTTALEDLRVLGEARWGQLVRKPFVAFTGNTAATVAAATAVSAARTTDRVNAQLVAPGSKELPFVVAARQLARIASVANNNPPRDYGSQRATGLVPGPDADQWEYPDRDQAVKAGSSTIEVKDGEVAISDVVTFYRPTGEPNPAFRYVVDIVKIMNVLFNLDLIFNTTKWDGAPLIPDGQPTVNPDARKPSHAKADINRMIDSLALNAIVSDPKTAKSRTLATIDSANPKRINWQATLQLSGNANVISGTFNFGFFYGEQAVVA